MKTIPCLPSFLILLSTASGQELTLKPIRQVSIAESGQPSKGIYGLGRAPKSIQQFQGMSVTYLQFQIPKLPKGQAIIRGQLKLHADYISSKKYTPRAWANVVRGQLPETFDWANQPPSSPARLSSTSLRAFRAARTPSYASRPAEAGIDGSGGERIGFRNSKSGLALRIRSSPSWPRAATRHFLRTANSRR